MNRMFPFSSFVRPTLQPVQSGQQQLQTLMQLAWNDKNALAALFGLIRNSEADVRADAHAWLIQMLQQIANRMSQLPSIPGQSYDW